MNLYLDEDIGGAPLIRLLRRDGHDVVTSADVGMNGKEDAEHFTEAIIRGRIILTHNHDDFEDLDILIRTSNGHHPGVCTVRRDNDKSRDMKAHDIVRAIRNLEVASIPISDELHILNHWR
jgi:predicted nuclease of predicted toxin-antitoxin system